MSYCRFSNGDVYMYPHVYGGIECCACCLSGSSLTFFRRSEAIAHLQEHRKAGYIVPDHAFDALRSEIEDEGDEVVLDIEESAKLYEMTPESLRRKVEKYMAGVKIVQNLQIEFTE